MYMRPYRELLYLNNIKKYGCFYQSPAVLQKFNILLIENAEPLISFTFLLIHYVQPWFSYLTLVCV